MANKIEINGKEYPVRWGLVVMQTFCDKTGFTIDEVQDMATCLSKNLLHKVTLLYEAIKYGCKRDGISCDITWDDIEAWFSDNPGFSAAFVAVWDSQAPPPVDDKKKEPEAVIEQL